MPFDPMGVPVRARQVIITSTASTLRSDQNVRENRVAAAVSATQFDLDAGASATADIYNGLPIFIPKGTGAGQNRTISDYGSGGIRRVTVDPALTTQPDNVSAFVIGRNLPPAWSMLRIGGAASNWFYSFRAGGTAATDRELVPGGDFREFWASEGGHFDFIELLSTVASDTLYVTWD